MIEKYKNRTRLSRFGDEGDSLSWGFIRSAVDDDRTAVREEKVQVAEGKRERRDEAAD
jgi:hypothetical protein